MAKEGILIRQRLSSFLLIRAAVSNSGRFLCRISCYSKEYALLKLKDGFMIEFIGLTPVLLYELPKLFVFVRLSR